MGGAFRITGGLYAADRPGGIFRGGGTEFGSAPNRNWWTTNPGQARTAADNLPADGSYTVSTGTPPNPSRVPGTGQHAYKADRTDDIPVREWTVHHPGKCDHSFLSMEEYEETGCGFADSGMALETQLGWAWNKFTINDCGRFYKPGWVATCADCGDEIRMLVYVSQSTVMKMRKMPTGTWYYYTCPYCGGEEQGAPIHHNCNVVSWNQYAVHYEGNAPAGCTLGGYMPDSFHMYNNATEYDGQPVVPVKNLTANAYFVRGYEFDGWNTRPDGSGVRYTDAQQIYNLTSENYDPHVPGTGVVTLYAQWRTSMSTLAIDPDGGTYGGSPDVTYIRKGYGESYVANAGIVPPAGFLVTFDAVGGTVDGRSTSTRRQSMQFDGWSQEVDDGRFIASTSTYEFWGTGGSTDTIRARYAGLPVVLPTPVKSGALFAGWYYDTAYTRPAGTGGSSITPTGDTTLYACWEQLRLSSAQNWTANSGKGAVDLSWTLNNHAALVYKLYQSPAGPSGPWTQVSSATDVADASVVDKAFSGSGTWIVPYTGLYTIDASGAKGGDCGSFSGGKGGSVSAQFWLTAGEKLTYSVGGGGGTASHYGAGGGYSRVVSDLQGELLTAGGGGGATVLEAGKDGGLDGSTVDTPEGGNGMAGGGGGHEGGAQGEAVLHSHVESCLHHEECSVQPTQAFLNASSADETGGYGVERRKSWNSNGAYVGIGSRNSTAMSVNTGLFAVPGSGTLHFTLYAVNWDASINNVSITAKNQNGSVLYGGYINAWDAFPIAFSIQTTLVPCHNIETTQYKTIPGDGVRLEANPGNYTFVVPDIGGNEYPGAILRYGLRYTPFSAHQWGDGQYCGHSEYVTIAAEHELEITESVTGVCFSANGSFGHRENGTGKGLYICDIRYDYTEEWYTCGYEEGDVESSMGANGGTSWAMDGAYNVSMSAGVNSGAASLKIHGEALGLHTGMSLPGVTAPDTERPNQVDVSKASARDGGRLTARISWENPGDNGTPYWHKCEAYQVPQMDTVALTSNIVEDTLTSGVKGYYYVIDNNPGTAATAASSYTASPTADVTFPESTQAQTKWLHVAAVDRAGNVGPTAHIRVTSDGSTIPAYWDIMTSQIIVDGDNIYPKPGADRTWYVKADGETSFSLEERATLNGTASNTYQPTDAGFVISGIRDVYHRQADPVSDGVLKFGTDAVARTLSGTFALGYLPRSETARSSRNMTMSHRQEYFMDASRAGQPIKVTPTAGAWKDRWETVWSDPAKDVLNGVTLIGDAKGPDYHGLEVLDALKDGLIDRRDGDIVLDITADDDLSGVKTWKVVVENTDSGNKRTYEPGPDGHIRIKITETDGHMDMLFSGDFTVTVTGEDNVGNVTTKSASTYEFDIETRVERILNERTPEIPGVGPHDPIFKTGESGYLYITTWGYVDYVEVEFPQGFTALDPGLDTVFVYRTDDYSRFPSYQEDEKYRFMIPLYAPEGSDFKIKVTAHKGDHEIVKYPDFAVYQTSGTVLDEFRDRLR